MLILFILSAVSFISVYFYNPVFAVDFIDLPLSIILFTVVLSALSYFFKFKKLLTALTITQVFCLLWIFLFSISAFPIFRADDYKTLIWNINDVVDSTKLEDATDTKNIRVVDQGMALNLMNKKLWEKEGLGSQYSVSTPAIQKVKNKLYWVAPLEYNWFWKWMSTNWTPGYVMVSASNPNDVTLVDNLELKYMESSYFNQSISRYAYFNGSMTSGLTDFSFEIDDEGNPFWVITSFTHKIGTSWNDATGVFIIDPKNGKTQRFDIKDTPVWVDRIQPESFIHEQLSDYGEYINGWLNPSSQGRVSVSTYNDELRLVYGKDGNSYWYAGMTNFGGNKDSLNGFMLVNTRTKETFFYKDAWVSEQSAMSSAEGKVQSMGYNSTIPVLYDINGVPTYVMSLKDKSGLPKLIAFVSLKNYALVGVGENVNDAYTNYRAVLAKNGNSSDLNKNEAKTMTWTVVRVSKIIIDNKQFVKLLVSSWTWSEDKSFTASIDIDPLVTFTDKNDKVSLRYEENYIINYWFNVLEMENLTLSR